MRPTRHWAIAATVALTLTGSIGAVGESEGTQGLAQIDSRLAEVTAERDALLIEAQTAARRYQKSRATQDKILAIIEDPSAFGTEEEVLDLLDELAAPGAPYGDEAWGVTTGWREGWRNTLFSDVDATIHTWVSWLAEDGSVGGSLWTWSGTATNGEPFDLEGIELSAFDEDGLLDSVVVHYPYEDTEVLQRFYSGG